MVDVRPQIEQEYKRLKEVFHVDVLAENKEDYIKHVTKLISKYHIGGLIFMRSSALQEKNLIEQFQESSTIPLLVAQDAEWANMRVVDFDATPYNMTLGALPQQGDYLIEKLGFFIGTQLKNLGVLVNFAPVIDVNNNPENPIINHRSFGENTTRVSAKGCAFMNGLHKAGVLSCAKHFPGHGNVVIDSHKALPIVPHTLAELEKTELVPFKALIKNNVDAIMTAHLYIPALEKNNLSEVAHPEPVEGYEQSPVYLPSTLSYNILTGLLKNRLRFNGLVFADCMMMDAISTHFKPGQAAEKALRAGVDVIVMSPDTPGAIAYIEKKAKRDKNLETIINLSALKILKTKEKLGLNLLQKMKNQPVNYLTQEIHILNQAIYDHAITLVKNENVLPLQAQKNKASTRLEAGACRISKANLGLKARACADANQPSLDGAEFILNRVKGRTRAMSHTLGNGNNNNALIEIGKKEGNRTENQDY